jgi:ankyrin repeat protein
MGEASFFGSVSSLWKTFTEAALHTHDAGEVVCVLDALDECRQNDRNELIKAINEFYRSSRNQVSCRLKVFMTSRPYGDIIQSQFSYVWGEKLPEIRLAGEDDDVAKDISDEIKIVTDKRIDRICNTFHLSKKQARLMKMTLGAAPGRTYLWIVLVFDGLLQNRSEIDKEYIENFIRSPPKNFYDAYEKILNRPKTQGAGYYNVKRARNILQMIVAAKRPLALREMSIALPFTERQPPYDDLADEIDTEERTWDKIRDYCGLLVIRVEGKLYLLHQTVREFLVTASPGTHNESLETQDTPDARTVTHSDVWKHSIDLMDANSVLAKACISYLHSNFAKSDPSLLDYSAIYWAAHYHQSTATCQGAAAEKTRDLCLGSEMRPRWTNIHEKHHWIPVNGSPLCLASALGLDTTVKMLLYELDSAGIDLMHEVDSKDKDYGQTPLSLAAENGHEAVVRLLVDTGKADIDSKSNSGRTPLSLAAQRGHEAVVRLLVDTGKADIDSKDTEYGQTPLSLAAQGGHEAVVRLLVDTGKADIDSKNTEYGQTPLSLAAQGGHEAVVRLLVDTGKAEIDSKDTEYGQTPLSLAAQEGHEAVVRLLVDTGKAEIDSKDNSGRTSLSLAAQRGHEAVVRLLVDTGKAEIDSKGNYGWTPLSLAAQEGHEAVVRLLVDTGKADIDSKDNYGWTPLSWAALEGHEAVVRLLVDTGKAEIDSKGNYGRTPLSWAALNGHEAVVRLLVDTGKAEIDSKGNFGRTPLSLAALRGHEAVVRLLVDTGKAEIDSKDTEYGRTPLSWAAERGHEAIVRLLESFSSS